MPKEDKRMTIKEIWFDDERIYGRDEAGREYETEKAKNIKKAYYADK